MKFPSTLLPQVENLEETRKAILDLLKKLNALAAELDGVFSSDVTIGGNLTVTGTGTINGDCSVGGNLVVDGSETVSGDLTLTGNLNGGTPWTSANDGAGSGLDADTVDGSHASAFQSADATLTALAGVVSAADTVPYFTAADTATVTGLTSFGRSLIDDSTAAAARDTLGVVTYLARNYIDGLILSNNGADANNDIDMAVGSAMDSTNAKLLVLGAAITKRLDAAWAAGTGNGGIDTGAKANSTWYAVHIIEKTADGTIDALFSLSPTAPTMRAGYGKFRRIGWIRTDSGGNILAFSQNADIFMLKAIISDVAGVSTMGTNRVARTVTCPINSIGRLYIQQSNTSGSTVFSWILPTDFTDAAATAANSTSHIGTGVVFGYEGNIKVDSSNQIATRHSASAATIGLRINTIGWIDFRGKE